jgi:hypothetical protein
MGTCAVPPSVTVTDGTNSYTLDVTTGNPAVTSTSSDSGPITLKFADGATIIVTYTQGFDPNGCYQPPSNVTVQYRIP